MSRQNTNSQNKIFTPSLFLGIFFVFVVPVVAYYCGTKELFGNLSFPKKVFAFSLSSVSAPKIIPPTSTPLSLSVTPLPSPSETPTVIITPTIVPTVVAVITDEKEILKETVNKYYEYISQKQIDAAYNLLSRNYKLITGPYQNFMNGFRSTTKVTVQDIKIQNPHNNQVFVLVSTTDVLNDKQITKKFTGIWRLSLEDGIWKLDKASIRQI